MENKTTNQTMEIETTNQEMVITTENVATTTDKITTDNVEITDFLNEINITYKPKPVKEYIKLTDIPQGIPLIISDMSRLETKYGKKLTITLLYKQCGVEAEYRTFLPDRFAKLQEPQIRVLTENPSIRFIYRGKDKEGSHQIDFSAK